MAPYRVVSIDGGGIRGILTARVLERIDEILPGFLSKVDLFAGTSTGGLLALGLGAAMSPTALRQMYERCAGRVFADSLLDQLKDLGNLIGAEYAIQPLHETLSEYFPGTTLGQLPRKVLVSAFQLDNEGKGRASVRAWKNKLFHNFPGEDSDSGELVADVGVRTSAAPSYFPIFQGYIDGGVTASSPAMCAVAQALDRRAGAQPLENVVLLSLGTGYNPHHLPLENADWGLVQWAPHLINIMLEGSQGLVDFQCRQILGDHYLRVDPVLPREIGMGSIKYIPELLETANQVDVAPIVEWLKRYFVE